MLLLPLKYRYCYSLCLLPLLPPAQRSYLLLQRSLLFCCLRSKRGCCLQHGCLLFCCLRSKRVSEQWVRLFSKR